MRRARRTHVIWGLGSTLALACASELVLPPASTPAAEAAGAPLERTPSPPEAPATATATATATPVSLPAPLNEPFYSKELHLLRYQAQKKLLYSGAIEDEHGMPIVQGPRPGPEHGPWPENGNALGEFVPIENEKSLAHFHEQLERLATGRDEDGKLRVAVYGASHTQGDLYTGYLRHYLQARFGNGGQGFVQLAQVNRWYRTFNFKVESNGFKTQHAQRKPPEKNGWFGLLGAAGVATSRYAAAKVFPKNESDPALTASHYELYYFAEPRGGDFTVRVDSEPQAKLSARGPAEPRYYAFEKPSGWHEVVVKPKGNGRIRLFGASIERAESGIVIDTLGINGTRAANMLLWDEALWSEHIRRRAPELVVFAYGTNETVDTRQPVAAYRSELKLVLERFRRTLPNASCVLMGPGDFPKEVPGGFIPRPRLLELIETQRELAPEFNCGFWDTYRFMGGEGSMARWARASPRMGQRDHIHLSARGYVRVGMGFGDALMRAYDAFMLSPPPVAH